MSTTLDPLFGYGLSDSTSAIAPLQDVIDSKPQQLRLGLNHSHFSIARESPDSIGPLSDRSSPNWGLFTDLPDQAGNSLTTARNIGLLSLPQTFQDAVSDADPNDYYRFTLNTNSQFNLTLNGLENDADVFLIRDANNNGRVDSSDILASSTAVGTGSEAIAQILQAGTYFVQVTQFQGDTPYQLSLGATAYRDPANSDTAGNTLATARDLGVLGPNQTIQEAVGNRDRYDYYRFSLDTTSGVDLQISGLTADADLYLIRDANNNGGVDSGDIIDYSIAAGNTPDSITTALNAGIYFIGVVQYAGNTAYTLQASSAAITLPSGYDIDLGYGLVDAAAAVAQVLSQSPFADVPNVGQGDWGIDQVNAPEVWAQGYTGQNVVVAVIDTGVDITHSDLDANIWTNSGEIAGNGIDDDQNGFIDDVQGWDFVGDDNTPTDGNGHGTHVAGTIAAENNGTGVTGIAPNAQIMPIRVLDDGGSGQYSDVARGIRYAVDNGADVINLSLGGGFSSEVAAAVQYAAEQGVMVVMAAGNAGGNRPEFPANLASRWGIAVGAIDAQGQLANFSNESGYPWQNYVVAPGVGIRSTTPNNSYDTYSGTSMAAPHVAGVVALMLSANPNLTPSQITTMLEQTASTRGLTT